MGSQDSSFFGEVCRRAYLIRVILVIALLFFLFHVPYPFVVEPGTALYVVATMNLVGLGLIAAVCAATLWKCKQADER